MPARAQAGYDIALLIKIHIRAGRQRGRFPEIQKLLAAVGHPDQHKAPAAQIACRRVDNRQGIAHGHGRVHGIAALFQHLHADFARQMLGADHHAVFRGRRSC